MEEKDRAMDHPSRAQMGCDIGWLGLSHFKLPGVRSVGGGRLHRAGVQELSSEASVQQI